MLIEKRIKLNNNYYYIQAEVEYKRKDSIMQLCLKNFKNDYYDGGNFSILIEEIEKNYTPEKALKYDKDIGLMADALFIYHRAPFLSGIRDVYFSEDDKIPYSHGYISKEEIEKYIADNKVEFPRNNDFKLTDMRTWKL